MHAYMHFIVFQNIIISKGKKGKKISFTKLKCLLLLNNIYGTLSKQF